MADRETDSRARRKIREAAERHGFEVEWLNWEPIDGCGCGGWTVVVKGYGTAGGNSWPEAVEMIDLLADGWKSGHIHG